MSIAVSDIKSLLDIGKSFDVADRESQRHVALVVEFLVLEEVPDLFDIDSGARYLPQTCMRRLAASTWISLVTSLLQELASQACSKLPDLTSLLPLLWLQWTLSLAYSLLVLTASTLGGLLCDSLGALGNDGTSLTRLASWGFGRTLRAR